MISISSNYLRQRGYSPLAQITSVMYQPSQTNEVSGTKCSISKDLEHLQLIHLLVYTAIQIKWTVGFQYQYACQVILPKQLQQTFFSIKTKSKKNSLYVNVNIRVIQFSFYITYPNKKKFNTLSLYIKEQAISLISTKAV